MKKLNCLFAFRKVFFDGMWHVRCVNCSETPSTGWDCNDPWELFVNSDQSVVVALPDEDCETSGIPMGPSVVYGRDSAIEPLPSVEKTRAIVAQNHIVIVTDHDMSEHVFPVFFSDQPLLTTRTRVAISFISPFLEELPDVQAFERKSLVNSADSGDLNLFGSRTSTLTRIPTGYFLPASIEVHGCAHPCVYSIKDWASDNTAIAELFTSSNATLGESTVLKRTVPGSSASVLGHLTPA